MVRGKKWIGAFGRLIVLAISLATAARADDGAIEVHKRWRVEEGGASVAAAKRPNAGILSKRRSSFATFGTLTTA